MHGDPNHFVGAERDNHFLRDPDEDDGMYDDYPAQPQYPAQTQYNVNTNSIHRRPNGGAPSHPWEDNDDSGSDSGVDSFALDKLVGRARSFVRRKSSTKSVQSNGPELSASMPRLRRL